jgi:uncharacterized membrane protein YfcA
MDAQFLDWSYFVWAVSIAGVTLAGVIRGFTGFAFAAVAVGAINPVAEAVIIVPIVLFLDLTGGVHLVAQVRHAIDRRLLGWMVLGALVGVPVGATVLVDTDPTIMRLIVAGATLLTAIMLWRNFRLRDRPSRPLLTGTGSLGGLLSGMAGFPGPPAIVLLLASPIDLHIARATIAAFILFNNVFTLSILALHGAIDDGVLLRAALLAPVALLSTIIGQRFYGIADPQLVRQVALVILAILGIVGILRVLLV